MSNKIYNFDEQKKIGTDGEEIVLSYIRSIATVDSVENVSKIKDFQAKDIDAVVKNKDGSTFTIEIKTDSYDSGNLYFELISSVKTFSLGCLLKTQADFVFYYFTKTKELYILNSQYFKVWVIENIGKLKIKHVKNEGYLSLGVIISKDFIRKNFKHYRVRQL